MSVVEFLLPDVGEGLSEAEIVRWVVPEGGDVTRDAPVVEVETAKSVVEIPAPGNGRIISHAAAEGDVVPIGSVLFTFAANDAGQGDGGGTATEDVAVPRPEVSAPHHEQAEEQAPSVGGRSGRVLAAPSTRRQARELGVDIATLTGSGPGGRVTLHDLNAAIAEPPVSAPVSSALTPRAPQREDEIVPLRGLRRQIARTMTQSWTTIPHITDVREVDATNLVAARARLKQHLQLGDVPFTFLPLVVKAVTAALSEVPIFNSSVDLDAETITYHGRHNIGLATASPDGLIVPVLKDADQLSLADIAREVQRLTTRARDRKATPEELGSGTFTITNFGSYGSWLATPIIRPPEAGILGIGRIQDRVVVVDGQPAVRPILTLCVSADHRLIDGDSMGGFLNALITYLTDPILLLGGQ